jgi:hypothetical protein
VKTKLYIFKSETKGDLRAFCGDSVGSRLPEQLKPWRAAGVVQPGRAPPHNLPRAEIEKSIETQGFQLWRLKDK